MTLIRYISGFIGAAAAVAAGGAASAEAPLHRTSTGNMSGATCWEVITKTEMGNSTSRLLMTAQGEQITGSWLTPISTTSLKGTITADAIKLNMPLSTMGQDVDVTYVGTIRGDSISGRADLGNLGEGTFVATKGCKGEWKQMSTSWSSSPKKLDFNDHEGFVSIFDGTLNGWDGNPKFWRAENGMIIGESSSANPSGNAYLTYRNMTAHDFDLRMEIKLQNGGTGVQYRSRTGIPWRIPTPPDVVANVGQYDPKWMLTGPQADLWAPINTMTFAFSGQVYGENMPVGIEAFTGQVVRQFGEDPEKKKLVATISPAHMLVGSVKINGWNQYEIIARGGVFIHIINGQLMAVLIDDDPKSVNHIRGMFGLEIEGDTKVMARNIFVRKLD